MAKWTKDNRKKPVGARCLAKKREKTLCQNFAMPNGRCRLHGGKLTGPKKGEQRALKHGLYAKGLIGDEKALYPEIKCGNIDDEIKILRIKLRRAWYAQGLWEQQHEEIQEDMQDQAQKRVEDEDDKPKKKTRLTRSLEPKKEHYRLESIETTKSKVYDKEGNPHFNRSIKTLKKKEDYSLEINTLTNLIGRLEAIRAKELGGSGDVGVRTKVEEFREFADSAMNTLPGGGM